MANFAVNIRHGASLPHWTVDGGVYSVTFRLADSLPQRALKRYLLERDDIIQTAKHLGRELTGSEKERMDHLYEASIQKFLDAGHGSCYLKQPAIAEVVAGVLQYFDGERYTLYAWCIMPNHVHVIVQPHHDYALSDILHTWKSFTAKKMNALLHRTGPVWQTEYFDHFIRSPEDLERSVEYVWKNPEQAGFKEWTWRWRMREELVARPSRP